MQAENKDSTIAAIQCSDASEGPHLKHLVPKRSDSQAKVPIRGQQFQASRLVVIEGGRYGNFEMVSLEIHLHHRQAHSG